MSNLNKPSSGGPAFPMAMPTAEGVGVVYGMTLREYAAIKLRVPESGTDWLDEMIRKSVRDELAGKQMPSVYSSAMDDAAAGSRLFSDPNWRIGLVIEAYAMADAMLSTRSAA